MVKNTVKTIIFVALLSSTIQAEGIRSYVADFIPTINFAKAKNEFIHAPQNAFSWVQNNKKRAALHVASLTTAALANYCFKKFKDVRNQSKNVQTNRKKEQYAWGLGTAGCTLASLVSLYFAFKK